MATYRIHRMRESARQQFRWAPHVSGATEVKPKDYQANDTVDAATPYAAWAALKDSEAALRPGDILEDEKGTLRIFKFVGFEEARWIIPEVAGGLEGVPLASGTPNAATAK